MKPILRIPLLEEEGLQPFLETVSGHDVWQGLELSGDLLDLDGGWEDQFDSFDLQLVCLADLLPADVSRYLAEAGTLARQALVRHLGILLERAAASGASYTSIDLGVERQAADHDLLQIRAEMLRDLMPRAERMELTICVPLRLPEDLAAGHHHNAVRLIKEVMHSHCRLVLEVFPEELDPSFDPAEFLADLHGYVAAIRWHYEPYLGHRLRSRFVANWVEALRGHGYGGVIVCCPRLRDPETLADELPRLERLLG